MTAAPYATNSPPKGDLNIDVPPDCIYQLYAEKQLALNRIESQLVQKDEKGNDQPIEVCDSQYIHLRDQFH